MTEVYEDREQDKEISSGKLNWVIFGGVFIFVVFVVYFWRNSKMIEKAEVVEETQQEVEVDVYRNTLVQEKDNILAQLQENFGQAKKNKELFLLINKDVEDESLEASFVLKDEKDTQRAKLIEQNHNLVEQKNQLVARLREIEVELSH